MNDLIFVTIGVLISPIPMGKKIAIHFDPTIETPIKAAKRLRKEFAEEAQYHGFAPGTKFKPSELYYLIYKTAKDLEPFAKSENYVPNICHSNKSETLCKHCGHRIVSDGWNWIDDTNSQFSHLCERSSYHEPIDFVKEKNE